MELISIKLRLSHEYANSHTYGVAVPDLLHPRGKWLYQWPGLVCMLQKTSSEQVLKLSPSLDWVEPGARVDPVQGVYGRHASSSVEHLGSPFFVPETKEAFWMR